LQPAIAIVEVSDLLLQFPDLLLPLLDRGRLPKDNVDELIGLISQPFEDLAQLTLIAHRDQVLINHNHTSTYSTMAKCKYFYGADTNSRSAAGAVFLTKALHDSQ
jgi:hypothetical protein